MKKIDFSQAQLLACAASPKDFPPSTLPEVAFLGRSNVGKSSLINRLTRHKNLARISSTPGKTRMAVFFDVQETLRLVDLPGYGYAAVSVSMRNQWQTLMDAYFSRREAVKGAVVIMDFRHAPTPLDRDLLDWLEQYNLSVIPVLNKADKLPRNKQIERIREIQKQWNWLGAQDLIPFSALNGLGKDKLESSIIRAIRRKAD